MESTVKKVIRLRRVLEIMPVSRSTWYAGINSGRFPKLFKIGSRAVAWLQKSTNLLPLAARMNRVLMLVK